MVAIIGTLGAFLALLAYAGLARKWWTATNDIYYFINIAASLLLLYNAFIAQQFAFILLNLVWLAIAGHGLFQGVAQPGRAHGSGP
jgi:hypothetical protein